MNIFKFPNNNCPSFMLQNIKVSKLAEKIDKWKQKFLTYHHNQIIQKQREKKTLFSSIRPPPGIPHFKTKKMRMRPCLRWSG